MRLPDLSGAPHRRYDPLTDSWVLVSPRRTDRPWQGKVDDAPARELPRYEPACYLCPGNTRASGEENPAYETTFAFVNDFAALNPTTPAGRAVHSPLMIAEATGGTCRVLCFSPRHDVTLADLTVDELGAVVEMWAEEAETLGATYRWVQIFENKGSQMGVSSLHPHGQVWASDVLPTRPAVEAATQDRYFAEHESPLLLDYAEEEAKSGERTVAENDDWIIVVPFWASWPYETLVLPRFGVSRLYELEAGERANLAGGLKELLTRYDGLFDNSFPYSMGWHGAPGTDAAPAWQLHAHFNPPLLRSASVRKFMVGYEMFAETQRDLTPELAAEHLRSVAEPGG